MGTAGKGKSSHCQGRSWAGVRGRTLISCSSHPSCQCFPVTGPHWEPVWSSSSRSDSGVPEQCREKQRMELRGRWRIISAALHWWLSYYFIMWCKNGLWSGQNYEICAVLQDEEYYEDFPIQTSLYGVYLNFDYILFLIYKNILVYKGTIICFILQYNITGFKIMLVLPLTIRLLNERRFLCDYFCWEHILLGRYMQGRVFESHFK